MNIEFAVIGMIQAMAVALIGGFFARDSHNRKKTLAATEARAELRAEESLLAIKLMSASVNLGVATALAIKDGKTNGATDAALKEAEKAETAYKNFINKVAVKQIAATNA